MKVRRGETTAITQDTTISTFKTLSHSTYTFPASASTSGSDIILGMMLSQRDGWRNWGLGGCFLLFFPPAFKRNSAPYGVLAALNVWLLTRANITPTCT
jgi:hypothetical protein